MDSPKAFVFHSDGYLWEVIDDLIDLGINALHPIEPKAMDIIDVKRHCRGRICIIGNIDLGYTLTRGCLLYTSPSPRDRTRSRMPASA